jgi:RNA polymerase sigma factor (sigma-70 family)
MRFFPPAEETSIESSLSGSPEHLSLMDPEQLFLSELKHIQSLIDFICRRHRCSHEEAEEFASEAKLRLISGDYAVFRQFEGKSSLRTYLTIVLNRYFLDFRIHRWGKWRPCAVAKRLGPTAIKLDELLSKDGYRFAEACQILQALPGAQITEEELSEIAVQLAVRPPRRLEGEEELQHAPSEEPGAEDRFVDRELQVRKQEVERTLRAAVAALPAQDQLILKMRIEDGFSVADIARTLLLPQKPIYRRLEGILKFLRRRLESLGVRKGEIAGILGLADREQDT